VSAIRQKFHICASMRVIGFVELNVEDQIIGFDVFLHDCVFLLEKYPDPKRKAAEFSPPP
jgi:hypothetical protein